MDGAADGPRTSVTSAETLFAAPQPDRPVEEDPPRRRGGKLYFLATAVAQVVALLRYVALARILGPRELGLAATLVVTGAFFDMISDTGSDRFLIQDRDGDDPEVQKLVQLVYFGRGAVIATAMVLLAIPLAGFYHEPRLALGFAVFALVPLLQGCQHLDLRRQQRHHDFRTESIAILVGELASFAAMLTAAFLTRSFTSILWGLIARAAILALISHLRASRRYGWSYQNQAASRLWAYSTPLMLTGLLLFIGSQADRVMIGRQLGFRDLGEYSAILLLIYYPCGVLLRYTHNLFIPLIAAPRENVAERNRVSDGFGGLTFSLGILMAAGFAVVAPPVIGLLYGARYTTSPLLVGLVGILQTTRFLINWPTTVAMSMGRSRTVLLNNLPRLLIFPGALPRALDHRGLIGRGDRIDRRGRRYRS